MKKYQVDGHEVTVTKNTSFEMEYRKAPFQIEFQTEHDGIETSIKFSYPKEKDRNKVFEEITEIAARGFLKRAINPFSKSLKSNK